MVSPAPPLGAALIFFAACTATQDLGSTGGKNSSGGEGGTLPGPTLQVLQLRQHQSYGKVDTPLLLSVNVKAPDGAQALALEARYMGVRTASGRVVRGAAQLDEDRRSWVDGTQTGAAGETLAPGASFGPWVIGFEFDAYADAPVAVVYLGPNEERSEVPATLEKGLSCTLALQARPLNTNCSKVDNYDLQVSTYADRDPLFCGGCANTDLGALVRMVIDNVFVPTGDRVDPTGKYLLGYGSSLPETSCVQGVQKCLKANETLCRATYWEVSQCIDDSWGTELKASGVECADLQTDAQHCGACNQPCGKGQTCAAGRCK